MTLTGSANIPAPDSRRLTIAELSGRRIVEMVWEDLKPSQIMTRKALENAITVEHGDRRIDQCRGASAGAGGAV